MILPSMILSLIFGVQRTALLPIIPVHVGEQVVARLDFSQPFFVHACGGQLVVQRAEAEQMVFHAATPNPFFTHDPPALPQLGWVLKG